MFLQNFVKSLWLSYKVDQSFSFDWRGIDWRKIRREDVSGKIDTIMLG